MIFEASRSFSHTEVAPERIAQLEARWDTALKEVQMVLFPNTSTSVPIDILTHESQSNFERQPDAQLLIGLAGPGAAGKGTLSRYLADELGYSKVVNTTTRPRREGEIDGIDYFFTDHSQFTTEQNLGKFALALERVGRGMYGISHEEIARKLSGTTTGSILEENPANIMELFSNSNNPGAQAVLLYVLPPYPVIKNSLARLQHRLSLEQDVKKQIITPEVFESTLGDRQIDEFLALTELPQHPNITPIFIVNDNLETTKSQIAAMFGETHDTR